MEVNQANGKVKAKTHPNAPILINFYDITPRGKRYNKDVMCLHYTKAENYQWMIDTLNKSQGNFGNRVWYRAN